MKSRLIVLSGKAGAGKDSVANLLTELHGWTLYSLAGPLKRFTADMFGFTDVQLYGPSSARNRPDPRWARPCPWCTGLTENGYRKTPGRLGWGSSAEPCSNCEGTGSINDNSPRRVLQLLGEEYLRQMIHIDALTMRARPDLEAFLSQGTKIVVNDARNDNDRNNLHDWLGAVRIDVRSLRADEPRPDKWRKHASENRLAPDDQLEYIIQNDEEWPFPALPQKVDTMLKDLYT